MVNIDFDVFYYSEIVNFMLDNKIGFKRCHFENQTRELIESILVEIRDDE